MTDHQENHVHTDAITVVDYYADYIIALPLVHLNSKSWVENVSTIYGYARYSLSKTGSYCNIL